MEDKLCDGVIGSRFISGSRLYVYSPMKRAMNRMFHFVVKRLFQIKQHDLTNNFKFFKASVIKSIKFTSDGFAINAETGVLPVLAGYDIAEVPISYSGRTRGMGKTKFSLFAQGWGYIKTIYYAFLFKKNNGKKNR